MPSKPTKDAAETPEVSAPLSGLPTPSALDYYSTMSAAGEIRRFTDSGIQQAIDQALAGLPDNRTVAVTAYIDKDEVRGAVVARVGQNWSLVGTLAKSLKDKGDLTYGAAVRWSI